MNIVIVGGGKVGSDLACLLLNAGHRIKVIEIRSERALAVQRDLPAEMVMVGSGTDAAVLEVSGIRQAEVVAAVTGADEVNLVVANLARFEFNVRRIIARVNHPKNAWMFTPLMGVDVALNQANLMAHLIIEEMSLGDMMTLLKLRKGQYSLVEEKIPTSALAAGKSVSELRLPEECVLVAVIRQGKLLIPKGSTLLQVGDEVLAIVHAQETAHLGNALNGTANSE